MYLLQKDKLWRGMLNKCYAFTVMRVVICRCLVRRSNLTCYNVKTDDLSYSVYDIIHLATKGGNLALLC